MLLILITCMILSHIPGNDSVEDECPIIEGAFFNESDSKEVTLTKITSLEGSETSFPYQFVMLVCSAPYSIRWKANVPQRYLYSYILDDEERSFYLRNETANANKEKYKLRLHIGNETLARKDFQAVEVSCLPVKFNRFHCLTKFTLKLYKTEGKLQISTKFTYEIPTGAEIAKITQKNDCVKDELVQFPSSRKAEFNCTVSDEVINDDKQGSSSIPDISLDKLHFEIDPIQSSFGMLKCRGSQPEVIFYFGFYFSLPKSICEDKDMSQRNLYLRRNTLETCPVEDLVNEAELLSMCVRNLKDVPLKQVYIGDNITVSCLSSIYYFAKGMHLELVNSEGKVLPTFLKNEPGPLKQELVNGHGGFRNLTRSVFINTEKISEIRCLVPVKGSPKWVIKSFRVDIKATKKLAFEEEGAESGVLTCNATGDPLPTLIWSRLNNEKLPGNQTLFQNSTWIASKLYIPEGKEYFGRYICTALNRFESIEKVFVNEGDSAILRIGRSRWFWILTASAVGILTVFVIILGFKIRAQARNLRLFSKAEINDFMFGRPELLLNENYEEINSYAGYLPYDRNQFEIKREQLDFNPTDILGSGAYGTVYKGVYKDENGFSEPVAVKTVNSSSDKIYFAALLSEIKIMCFIGRHENVVRLVGACTKYLDKRQIYVAMEYCENGDLLSYVQKHRDVIIHNANQGNGQNLITPLEGKYCQLSYTQLLLSPQLLLVWAHQIAKGMSFLSSKKVIHGDLAARNILLGADLTPKIGDFGLSKQLQKYSNYVQKGDDLVPWRWLAIECLQFMKFSIKSDVWAFGIILYEILSLGQVPFANYTYSEVFIVALCQGERPLKPLFASKKIYEMMLDCWKHSPEERPSFQCLESRLKSLILEKDMDQVSFRTSSNSETYVTSYTNLTTFPLLQIPDSVRYVDATQFQFQTPQNCDLHIDNSDPSNAVLYYVKPQPLSITSTSSSGPLLSSPGGGGGIANLSYIDWNTVS